MSGAEPLLSFYNSEKVSSCRLDTLSPKKKTANVWAEHINNAAVYKSLKPNVED